MARIQVDADELIMALDDHGGYVRYFLDKTTGEVIPLSEYAGDVEELEEFQEQLDAEPGRFEQIDPLPSRLGFAIMEDFANSVAEGKQRQSLLRALSRKKPFRNFKDAVDDMGELRDEWFLFHDLKMREHAREWLEDNEIDAVLKGRNVDLRLVKKEDFQDEVEPASRPDKRAFWQLLAAGLCASQPLLPLLRSIEKELTTTAMGEPVETLAGRVAENVPLSDAMEEQPEVFSMAHVHLIRGGELFGSIDRVAMLILELTWRCPECGHM